MKITKVMLESMIRQELKKVLKEAQIPPHVKDPRGSGKIYLKTDVESLYAGLVEDVERSINIQQYSADIDYASALKREILEQVEKRVAQALLTPSNILMKVHQDVAENFYPEVMTNEGQIYDDILEQLAKLYSKYSQMEKGFEREEIEAPDASEDDFY